MSRFNLLDEPWILVMTDDKGSTEEVSLTQLFKNAQNYKQLAGEMQMQNFAILRLLLAVLHTVFSRFDAQGQAYPYIVLDEKFKQLEELDEDDYEDYANDLMGTWEELWKRESFPEIVGKYLKLWQDRFYLFDEKHPFYQVTSEELLKRPIKAVRGTNPTEIRPKTMNRTISESGNKTALFAPRYATDENRNRIREAELARWLVLYQGVVGTFDKAVYIEFKGKKSKGWLYDIGGIVLRGTNLFETLLLNLALFHPQDEYQMSIQRPCWERTGDEIIAKLLGDYPVDNLAELYTNWSRAMYIDPEVSLDGNFTIGTVKLPEVNHQDQFLELMTMWKYQTEGDNKGFRTPQKHQMQVSLWRSFGSVFLNEDTSEKRPGIIDWFYQIEKITQEKNAIIESYGMESDRKPPSWEPVDEYYDSLDINEYVLADVQEDGWVPRINDEVERTKEVIENTFRRFANDVRTIRNLSSLEFTNKIIRQVYFEIDQPFRHWLNSLEVNQDKDERVQEWRSTLKEILREEADFLVESAGNRDYKGIFEKEKQFKNIATAYNQFNYWLNRSLGFINNQGGGLDGTVNK